MKNFILLSWLLVAFSATAQDGERIMNFESSIVVNKDRSVRVVETIQVNALGYSIQRGIYRDIITKMRDEGGRTRKLDLTVVEVLKNGESENYVTESNGIYTRIKIGNADIILDPGEYTYTIEYILDRQVRFFTDYDELYWNVTGNEWMFTIDRAAVTISLPEEAQVKQHAGYSGPTGATGCSCKKSEPASNKVHYETTALLNPYEGLTVGVGWQKGVVPPPTEAELEAEAFNDNRGIYYGIIGLLIIFGYLMFAWFRVGRDPAKGAVIPRFTPPDGFSPAACRYVLKMGFDNKAFAAAVVSMAVKGYLTIDQTTKHFQLKKNTDDTSMLTNGEKKVAENIFHGSSSVTLDNTYDSWIAKAVKGLESNLDTEFRNINFFKNSLWMLPAVLSTIGLIIFMFIEASVDEPVFVAMIIVTFFSIFVIIPAISVFHTVKQSSGCAKYVKIFSSMFFLMIAIVVPVFLEYQFHIFEAEWMPRLLPYLFVIIGLVFLNALFFYLMQAPTVLGRKRMDEIEGLRMFMEVAEKDRLNMLNPPEKTPQLFEKLLPYAIALDVENKWGLKFNQILHDAMEKKEYNPTWYRGSSPFFANTLSHSLGSSLSSSLSSSSTPPSSSSSGSGGGGSSGGGGGGGGGGGW